MDAAHVASALLQARAEGHCLDAADWPMPDDLAYVVQEHMTQYRLDRRERIIGWKLGYTSEAMRVQMGISTPNFGPLTDAMLLYPGRLLPPALQPKVEPEIALVLDVAVDAPLDAVQCREAVRSAHVALEIVDSIWCGYRFTWAQNTADGSSAAYVVVGDEIDRDALSDMHVELEINDKAAGVGAGHAAMGDPYRALSWLTGQLAEREHRLSAGDVIITGGLCPAVTLGQGDSVRARCGSAIASVRR